MKGRIHSIESMGLVDGPGIRTVVFMQGCPLKCKFCHNADSWDIHGGEKMTADELMTRIKRFKPYFTRSGGGVTFSGGEPLLQPDFLLEMLKRCKEDGIHTCIDTSGVGLGDYGELLALTDLVLYDIKATEADAYHHMCSADIAKTKEFSAALAKSECEVKVRAVIIPNFNDTEEYMKNLDEYIKAHIPAVKEIELLPYHKMGAHKFAALGLTDPLADTEAMDKEHISQLKKYLTERGYK